MWRGLFRKSYRNLVCKTSLLLLCWALHRSNQPFHLPLTHACTCIYSDRLFQTANSAQCPLCEELYKTRIANRVFFLRNFKFHDLCRSSGAVTASDDRHKSWNLKLPKEKICVQSWFCTAWDSEIESLTSLIKLHQSERHCAPCGQIGAATQTPQLATSPTLKKFWVARAFKVRWACTCCHDRTVFNCCLLPRSHFSLFFVSLGAFHNPERSLNSRVPYSTPASSNVLMTRRRSCSL